MKTKKYLISGRVQGVGYRWFVHKQARAIGVTGTVRNLSDGRVEVIACGTDTQLELLEIKLHQGPSMARVDGIQAVDYQWKGSGFQIH